ncbi:ribonuclease E/G [Caldovatus aquaticus]|uniref:Ribonuclease E/G n=1 Tax=Caldovatus aquaticus TaxID=2865671 RepID=A0ABS7EXB9_9PROT|nr:ribonuclease E/G [Caldovatus aquaticus]
MSARAQRPAAGTGGGALIRVSAGPGERRIAVLGAGGATLLDYEVERPARPEGIGDLHRARVVALAPAMGGAFVELAGGETGFLPEAEAAGAAQPGPRPPLRRVLREGQVLAVRVIRAAQGGKGPRVTAQLTEEEAALAAAVAAPAPALLRRAPEAALRLALVHSRAVVETDDAALAARLRGALGPARVRLLSGPAFDEALEAEIETLSGPEVPLPGGGRLLIHPTPALVAMDVDAGSAAGARDRRAQEALNQAAVEEAARQIRLRRLGGAIFLDLAGLAARRGRRGPLLERLRAALAADPLARLVGLTGLGFAEIVRTRVHAPLHEVLGWPEPSPLTRGLAALRRVLREAAARRSGRPLALRAAPAVVAALRAWPGALDECAAALGQGLELRADPTISPGAEVVEEAGGDGRG